MTDTTVGAILTSADPEPPVGTMVRDDCGLTWVNDGYRPCCWVRPDLVEQDIHDPETWTKIAGNYGPVTILRAARRRCTSEACDEYDGIHCYGDGCAMAGKEDRP